MAAFGEVGAAFASSSCNAANNSPSVSGYPHYSWDISAASYPATGSFNAYLPSNDNPYLYGILTSESGYPTATVTLSPLSGVFTSTVTSTIPIALSTIGMTTLTFVSTLEIAFTQTYGGWIVAAIVVVLVIAVLFFALRKRRTTHGPQQATLSQFVKAPTSCIKCGAELPPASDFCNKCGTKQTS